MQEKNAIIKPMRPRDYHVFSEMIRGDIQKMLDLHQEAFECLVYKAKDSAHNENTIHSANIENVTALESSERRQSYEEPVLAKAVMVYDTSNKFGMVDSALTENFQTAQEPISLRVSVDGIRKYSIIQWKECSALDPHVIEDRTVYVHNVRAVAQTLAIGPLCECYPLFAEGEIPLHKQVEESEKLEQEELGPEEQEEQRDEEEQEEAYSELEELLESIDTDNDNKNDDVGVL